MANGFKPRPLRRRRTIWMGRQQNTDQLPRATAMAGVDMRLGPNAYRELRWHTANEFSLMLKGSVKLAPVDENGQSFKDDISAGDVWFFPAGVLHSIQALEEDCEFLLIFDDGSSSEDATFLASELFSEIQKRFSQRTSDTYLRL
jgi:oxalate decarboxylase family bicupin protein